MRSSEMIFVGEDFHGVIRVGGSSEQASRCSFGRGLQPVAEESRQSHKERSKMHP